MNIYDLALGFFIPDNSSENRENDYKCGKHFEKVKYEVIDSLKEKGIRINERELYEVLETFWEWRIVD